MAYTLEYGVKGAYRISTREYATLEDATLKAKRWAASNSQGHYWAEVTRNGKSLARFNLK